MKNLTILLLFTLLFVFNTTAQEQTKQDTVKSQIVRTWEYLPPLDEPAFIIEAGAGIGVPYGVIGGKLSVGDALVSGDVAVGIIPFAWEVSAAVGGSLHLFDRYNAVVPRLTIQYTTTAAYNLILKQTNAFSSSSTSTFYKEGFPGYAILGGVDIRLGKSSEFFLTLSIGAVVPFVGIDEVEKKYNQKKAQMISQGYTLESEVNSLNTFPKFAIGLNYVIGRSLMLR
ncbi:MAG: hypothetical protein HYZ34_07905 [Ignavibacteriae bacterium]|nr:hypothetical protein [Ignavibacteriota bacterium]